MMCDIGMTAILANYPQGALEDMIVNHVSEMLEMYGRWIK